MIYTPTLKILRYIGEEERPLWEVRVKDTPTLKKGDLVVLNETVAILMLRKYGFELADDVFLNSSKNIEEEYPIEENSTEENSTQEFEEDSENEEDNFIPPFKEELNSLSDEEIKKLAKHFDITVGNKKAENLKALIMPFLKSKEDDTSK